MQYQKNTAQTSLKRLALVVWFTSLFLPGFHSAYGAEAWGHWTGWTLLTIIPFAFLQPPSCLALYSNFFFWLALMRKDGLISLSIMWMMALTITFHTQIMINESPTFAPVVAWGWGAVLWLLSYIILTLSRTVRNHPKPASRIYTTGFVCCLIIAALVGLNIYQYQRMNDDERQHLLPFGMVFTTQKISGIKIQPFPENLYLYDDTNIIIENAVPDLKIIKDSNLKNSENPLPNAKPGYYYTILNSHSDSIIIARPGNAPDYRYQIVPTSPQHFLIKLSYGNGTPIWQQEYRTDMPLYYHKTYPEIPDKIRHRYIPEYKLETDIALQPCPLPQDEKHIQLYNLQISTESGIFSRQAFCNNKYTLFFHLKDEKYRPYYLGDELRLYIQGYLISKEGKIENSYSEWSEWPQNILLESATLSSDGRELLLKAEQDEYLRLKQEHMDYQETANTHMLNFIPSPPTGKTP